jgi:hypothetical protein
LFSATGFTDGAQRFAITQQISLIDLSAPAFKWLLRAADRLADALFQLAMETGVTVFPVAQAREALRRALGTWPLDDFGQPRDFLAVRDLDRGPSGYQAEILELRPNSTAQLASVGVILGHQQDVLAVKG